MGDSNPLSMANQIDNFFLTIIHLLGSNKQNTFLFLSISENDKIPKKAAKTSNPDAKNLLMSHKRQQDGIHNCLKFEN